MLPAIVPWLYDSRYFDSASCVQYWNIMYNLSILILVWLIDLWLVSYCTLMRKLVLTQPWGCIVITSYLGVFNFGCIISFVNKVNYNCKINGTLTFFIKLRPFVITQNLCGCGYKNQDIVFLWGCVCLLDLHRLPCFLQIRRHFQLL